MSKRNRSRRPARQQPSRRRIDDRAPPRRAWRLIAAVAALALLHYVLAVTSVRNKSNTYDEIAHLTRGYSYVLAGDFRLGPPHPPLAHYWAALPGLGENVKFPPQLTPEKSLGAWRRSDMWEIGRQFFYYNNLGNAAIIDSLLFRGRAMIALFSVALALIVFFWARRLFGDVGGVIALSLYALSPTMLAHGRLVTTDCAAALFFVCSLATIWWMLHRITPLTVLASAAALTGLFLAKLSAVLIIPIGVVLLVMRLIAGAPLPLSFRNHRRLIRARIAQLGCFLAVMVFWIGVVYAGIWAAYGFRYVAMAGADSQRDSLYTNRTVPEDRTFWEYVLRGDDISPTFRDAIFWLRDHRVFPEAYVYSAAYARQTARGRMAFLDGELNIRGFRAFFPLNFLYKTPLPLFGMLLLAAAAPWAARRAPAAHEPKTREGLGRPAAVWGFIYGTAPLWTFFCIYWFCSIRSTLNIGHRHIMPTYPVLFILCGATACYWRSGKRVVQALPAVFVGLFALASLSIYPHYLTYFNWIAGGADKGYRHLVDSSLDWGQDLPALKAYLDRRREDGHSEEIYHAYFGSAGAPGLKHYGIDGIPLPHGWRADATGDLRYAPGIYAISATHLQQVYIGVSDRRHLNPWTLDFEETYRRVLPEFQACMDAPDTPAARQRWTRGDMRTTMKEFTRLMFARLCAYLRAREPDDMLNHTILIYDLDAAELDAALHGDLPVLARQATASSMSPQPR